jgi:uroporphyrinogen decarboxylase
VYATIERQPVDRPASWLGAPDAESLPALFTEFGVRDLRELQIAVGDDFYAERLPYRLENGKRLTRVWDWYLDGVTDRKDRTLTADGCFKNCESPEDISFFKWPDPAKYLSPEDCRDMANRIPEGKAGFGLLWSVHFQDVCASFGMETAMVNMIANPELVEAVNKKILDFYLGVNEIFFKATKGKFQVVLFGNDLGSQRDLMFSPDIIRRFVIPGCKLLVEMAHHYGLKVIYHSCGSIEKIIPDLIGAGVDAIHPIQALATGMDPRQLKEKYGGQVSFCGGVDTQNLLVKGSAEDVAAKVRELREIFPTGLIISPSHEGILPDIPPGNIRALFDTIKEV